jgi:hypothetical protein
MFLVPATRSDIICVIQKIDHFYGPTPKIKSLVLVAYGSRYKKLIFNNKKTLELRSNPTRPRSGPSPLSSPRSEDTARSGKSSASTMTVSTSLQIHEVAVMAKQGRPLSVWSSMGEVVGVVSLRLGLHRARWVRSSGAAHLRGGEGCGGTYLRPQIWAWRVGHHRRWS